MFIDRRSFIGGGIVSVAGEVYPPVEELQNQLHLHRGDLLPKLVVWKGHQFQPEYRQAEHLGGGVYRITVKLMG